MKKNAKSFYVIIKLSILFSFLAFVMFYHSLLTSASAAPAYGTPYSTALATAYSTATVTPYYTPSPIATPSPSVTATSLATATATPEATATASHKVCSNTTCIKVKGAGDNECDSDSGCQHKECTNVGRCVVVAGDGNNGCRSSDDCAKRCNYDTGTCEPIDPTTPGNAGPLCALSADPVPEECSEKKYCNSSGECTTEATGMPCSQASQCVKRCTANHTCAPDGENAACNGDTDCTEKRCSDDGVCAVGNSGAPCLDNGGCQKRRCSVDGSCSLGGTGRKCTLNSFGESDCPKRIKICIDGACKEANEADPVGQSCALDKDCQPETHMTCTSGKCVRVTGAGQSTCGLDSDCAGSTCSAGKCQPGIQGGALCGRDTECPKPTVTAVADITAVPLDNNPLEGAKYRIDIEKLTNSQDARNTLATLESAPSIFVKGEDNAKVKVDIFQDFTCGMCKKAYFEWVKKTLKETTGIQVRFRDYPLIQNAEATTITKIALCAAEKDAYLQFMDAYYSSPTKNVNTARSITEKYVDREDLDRCLNSKMTRERIAQAVELAKNLSVDGTPTFFINGAVIEGTMRFELMDKLIESLKVS